MSAGQGVGPPERESRSFIQPPLPPDAAPRAHAAAAWAPPVGLRPPFVPQAAAHSHPDCRVGLTLIVALYPSADAALRHAPAKSDLHGHHARQETGRVGWAEESSRYGCAKRFKP